MSQTVSPSTGRRYGLAMVCRIWEVARSSVYAGRRRQCRRLWLQGEEVSIAPAAAI